MTSNKAGHLRALHTHHIRPGAVVSRCLQLLVICLSCGFGSATAASDKSLAELLEQGVQSQLQGDYDRSSQIAQQMKANFPTNAIGNAFEMNTLVTRLSWDTTDTQFDGALESEAKGALKLCKQQIRRDPDAAAGYHLCGQAHFALTFLYAARGSYYSAGRHSSKTIEQLEAALERDPNLADAKMHLGATYYYADNLPPFVKAISRFLWFIPTGNSEKALPYMRDAAENGEYLGDAAKFIFADLVMSSEPTLLEEAGAYLTNLVRRYPANRRFQLKHMQYLAQTERYPELLNAVDSFTGPEHCCPVASVDESIARLWRIRAYLALNDQGTAELEFASIDTADLPEWGQQWHSKLGQQLAAR